MATKESIENEKKSEMFDAKTGEPKPVELRYDVGHNHSRGSQGAVAGVLE